MLCIQVNEKSCRLRMATYRDGDNLDLCCTSGAAGCICKNILPRGAFDLPTHHVYLYIYTSKLKILQIENGHIIIGMV